MEPLAIRRAILKDPMHIVSRKAFPLSSKSAGSSPYESLKRALIEPYESLTRALLCTDGAPVLNPFSSKSAESSWEADEEEGGAGAQQTGTKISTFRDSNV